MRYCAPVQYKRQLNQRISETSIHITKTALPHEDEGEEKRTRLGLFATLSSRKPDLLRETPGSLKLGFYL